ncbi:hydantoinase/oxoprolinase N-terminal domain-containing protein [Haladaptatus halobius]|uniref:hydantoinase/oxoprolinase N-terminal domain-containing protein n=1 Tax=Haladaptatus halobius TaxID=2884875 RepID=UPI001D0AB561|nr:hydantoinase/oxoprolinase N-terminal domain-containing protein [Haladaptatus halobius]
MSVDIGGTFTDCVVVDENGDTTIAKSRSTPENNFKTGFFDSIEAAAVKRGIDAADLLENSVRVTHGSTVATNIMVEKSGADIALITTKGHEDTLDLTKGRGRIHSESPEHLLRIANVRKPDPLVEGRTSG